MTKARKNDQFLYALLAVVFTAMAVILVKIADAPDQQVLGASTVIQTVHNGTSVTNPIGAVKKVPVK